MLAYKPRGDEEVTSQRRPHRPKTWNMEAGEAERPVNDGNEDEHSGDGGSNGSGRAPDTDSRPNTLPTSRRRKPTNEAEEQNTPMPIDPNSSNPLKRKGSDGDMGQTDRVSESDIVRGILKNDYYHTASALYGTISVYGPLKFKSLKDIARHCHIAEILANSIAEHHVGQGLPTTIRMGKNIRPYLLSIGHFFEQYCTGLANYTNDALYAPLYQTPDAEV